MINIKWITITTAQRLKFFCWTMSVVCDTTAGAAEHRANLNVRRHFFTERLVNRWNSLSQYTVKADTVNSFKRELQRMTQHQMGFFEDWRPINATAAQVLLSGLVWPHQVNDQVNDSKISNQPVTFESNRNHPIRIRIESRSFAGPQYVGQIFLTRYNPTHS